MNLLYSCVLYMHGFDFLSFYPDFFYWYRIRFVHCSVYYFYFYFLMLLFMNHCNAFAPCGPSTWQCKIILLLLYLRFDFYPFTQIFIIGHKGQFFPRTKILFQSAFLFSYKNVASKKSKIHPFPLMLMQRNEMWYTYTQNCPLWPIIKIWVKG
jgi:hypothetical protein